MTRRFLMMIWYAVLMHYVWATLLLLPGSAADRATATHALGQMFGGTGWTAVALVLVATLALGAIVSPFREEMAILFLIPQQLLLGVSAAGAVHAMWASRFADGVARDRSFIIADQLPAVLAFVLHTATIVLLFYFRGHRRERPAEIA